MSRLTTLVANRLKTRPVITALTGSGANARIFDVDYRVAGWNTAPVPVVDPYGLLIGVTIVVADSGSQVPPFSRMRMAEEDTIFVWAFAKRTAQGADQVDTVLREAKRALNQWQEPATMRLLLWNMRLGLVPAEDGVYDRASFRAAGIPI